MKVYKIIKTFFIIASICTGVLAGNLSLVGSISNDALKGAQKVLVTSDDKYVYAAGENGNSISWYQRNTSGTLSLLGNVKNDSNGVSGIEYVIDLSMSLDERYLYAVTYYSNTLVWFSRNTQRKPRQWFHVTLCTTSTGRGLVFSQRRRTHNQADKKSV